MIEPQTVPNQHTPGDLTNRPNVDSGGVPFLSKREDLPMSQPLATRLRNWNGFTYGAQYSLVPTKVDKRFVGSCIDLAQPKSVRITLAPS